MALPSACLGAAPTAVTALTRNHLHIVRPGRCQASGLNCILFHDDVFTGRHSIAIGITRSVPRDGLQHQRLLRQSSHAHRPSVLAAATAAAEAESLLQETTAAGHIDREAAANALLELLAPDAGTPPPVAAMQLPSGAGVGLVATQDVSPGAPILTVPFSLVLETTGDEADGASTPGEREPWSAAMARMLLDAVPAAAPASEAAAAPDAAASTQQDPQQAARRHWAAALPERVPLAFAHASEAQLRGIGDEGLADEALAVRQLMLDSYEASAGAHSLEAWRWAWSCVHSRSFKDGAGGHLTAPGIDMANHAFVPSATVRLVRDPDRCQGYAAMADVCDPEVLQHGEARVELRAGDAGIRAGEEVTISYGPWPDDVYALFYGFLPGQPAQPRSARSPDQAAADAVAQQQPIGNPHQKIMLFGDVRHLAAFAVEQFGPLHADGAQQQTWGAAVADEVVAAVGSNFQRLFMTPVGFDERLAMAAQQLLRTHVVPLAWPPDARDGATAQQALQPSDILAVRMSQIQATPNEAAHEDPSAEVVPNYMEAVLQCAAERRQLLNGALQALWGM